MKNITEFKAWVLLEDHKKWLTGRNKIRVIINKDMNISFPLFTVAEGNGKGKDFFLLTGTVINRIPYKQFHILSPLNERHKIFIEGDTNSIGEIGFKEYTEYNI